MCEGKDCLTVLDFIGQSNKNYRFADKYRALIGKTKQSVENYVKNGFVQLPKGCFIKLEKQAKEYVLRNIKGLKNNKDVLISKIKYFENDSGKELNLKNFLEYNNIEINEFYKRLGYQFNIDIGCDGLYPSGYSGNASPGDIPAFNRLNASPTRWEYSGVFDVSHMPVCPFMFMASCAS